MESPSETNGAAAERLHEIRVTFSPDGNMALHAEGVGPPQFWAAARLVELWGDSEFASQQLAAAGGAGRIVKAGDMPKGIRRLIGNG